jgi:glycosyltransferase involved in cell wall biosynthesis
LAAHRIPAPEPRRRRAYRKADALVPPSLSETVGVTSLEPMMCGCPAVAANAAAIPEVTGDAALLVDPEGVPGRAEAIHRVLTGREVRDSLVARGYRNAAEYSTEREAKETVVVNERAVGGRLGTRAYGRREPTTGSTLDAGADGAGAA